MKALHGVTRRQAENVVNITTARILGVGTIRLIGFALAARLWHPFLWGYHRYHRFSVLMLRCIRDAREHIASDAAAHPPIVGDHAHGQ